MVLIKIDPLLESHHPDAVLIYGDTNSCLAAIAAKKRQIPIFHMEAGNRSYDERVPEEVNRRVIDHISDINMPLSDHARDYLVSEGIPAQRIIKTGSVMKEVFHYHQADIERSTILQTLSLEAQNYFIVSAHRQENVDDDEQLQNFLDTLTTISEKYNKTIIVSTHPRTRKRIDDYMTQVSHVSLSKNIKFMKPFGFFDYIQLQLNAYCVLSDSGSVTEDASLLNLPAVTLRYSHERPEGMDVGTLVMSGLKRERVINAIDLVVSHHNSSNRTFRIIPDYDEENVSKKVARIIISYTDYINKFVWQK